MREDISYGSLPPVRTPGSAARSQSAEPPMWGVNSRGDSLFLYQQFSEHPMHDYNGDWNSRISRDMKKSVMKEFRQEVKGLIDTQSKKGKKKTPKARSKSPPERILFEREEAFHNRLEPKFSYKAYDALSDKHCPYVHSKKFRKSYSKYLEIAEAERPAMKKLADLGGDTTPWTTKNASPKKKDKGPSIKEMMGINDDQDNSMVHRPKRLSAILKEAKQEREIAEKEASEAVQDRPKRSKLSCELEAYKCIVLREGYVQRLKEIFMAFAKGKGRNNTTTAEVANLFFSLRLAGLGVVEAISEWRDTGDTKPEDGSTGEMASDTNGYRQSMLSDQTQDKEHEQMRPFLWNGQNYLIKMQTDLDFVDEVPEIVSWLGFSAMSNPFLIPSDGDETESGDDFVRHLFYNKEGIVVFNKTSANPLQSLSTHKMGSPGPSPSGTLNDGSKTSVGRSRRSKTPGGRPGTVDKPPAVIVKPKSSSHINLARVRAAEKIVLDEKEPEEEAPPPDTVEETVREESNKYDDSAERPSAEAIDDVMAELDLEGCF